MTFEAVTDMKIEKIRNDWYRVVLNIYGKKITVFAYSQKEANEKACLLLRTGEDKDAKKIESDTAKTKTAG